MPLIIAIKLEIAVIVRIGHAKEAIQGLFFVSVLKVRSDGPFLVLRVCV